MLLARGVLQSNCGNFCLDVIALFNAMADFRLRDFLGTAGERFRSEAGYGSKW
jgi:hypothetical protein